MSVVHALMLMLVALCVLSNDHVSAHNTDNSRLLTRDETLEAIKMAQREMHSKATFSEPGRSWNIFDLPPDVLMSALLRLIEEVDNLDGEAEQSSIEAVTEAPPTLLERIENIVGSLVVLVRNIRMALEANGDSSNCDTCMLGTKLLKAVSIVLDWDEQMAPIVNRFCHPVVMAATGQGQDHANELCLIVNLQGPAVYAAMKNPLVLPRQHCIYYHKCPEPVSDDNDLETGLPDASILPSDLFSKIGSSEKRLERRRDGKQKRSLEDAIRIVQMTDVHIDLTYKEGKEGACTLPICCFEELPDGAVNGNDPGGKWGHYNCNPPLRTIELFLQTAAKTQPEILLYSGDTPSNIMWRESWDGQMNCTRVLTESIAQHMPGVKAYPAIGNHETFPGNQYYHGTPETKEMNRLFAQWWGPLGSFSQENIDTMEEAGYLAQEIKPDLWLISFNNIYWFGDNWYAPIANAEVPASANIVKRMQRYTLEVVKHARNTGGKVIFMSHMPAGSGIWMHTKWISNLIAQYSDVIVLHIGGHHHDDNFKIVRDPVTYEARGVALVAGAISTQGSRNPAFRLFYLDPDTYEVMDYDQYNMDLIEYFNSDNPVVERLYRASEDYGVSAITGAEYDKLISRMMDDPSIYNKAIVNYEGNKQGINPNPCSDLECMYGRLCSFSHGGNPDHRNQCNRREIPITPLVPLTTTLAPCATQVTTTTASTTASPPSTTTSPDTSGADVVRASPYLLITYVIFMLITCLK